MNDERHDPEVEARLGRWLKDDAPPMTSRLRASVHDEVRATRQLPTDGPAEFRRQWRGRSLRPDVLAAAAIVVVAFVSALAVLQSPPVPGTTGAASRAPSERPSDRPSIAPPTMTPPPAGVDPFTASWNTLDVDGSVMLLVFEGTGSSRRVTVTDLRATVCAGGSHVVEGSGTIDGPALEFTGSSGCLGQPLSGPGGTRFTYDEASGTLRMPFDFPGGTELVWVREPLTDAFTGTWLATGTDGSALTLTLTGSGLARTVSFDDAAATYCGGPAFSAQGNATIGTAPSDGRFIRIAFHGSCVAGDRPRDYEEKYEFVLASNTLSGPLTPLEIGATPNEFSVTWRRP